MKFLDNYFGISKHGSTVGKEFFAGMTTFFTMAYVVIVHPKILEAGGLPFASSLVVTILITVFGTLLMGVYAKRPFAIAPYMGENAFVAFTVVGIMGYSWGEAFAAIFISGIVFILLTLLKIREWLVNAIPQSLKIAFTVGIGFFLTFIGLNESGIIQLGNNSSPVHIGHLSNPSVLLAIFGFLLMSILMIKKVPAAILIGIVSVTLISIISGLVQLPQTIFSLPPDFTNIVGMLDFSRVFTWGFFPIILTILVLVFVDTMGTLIGLSHRAGFLDKKGNLPEIEKPMLCDALSTTLAGLLGTTTAGAYIESATGIESGGRTGLTAVFTASFFLLTLFLAPLLVIIPSYAYAPALIVVGMLMLSPITALNFSDLTEVLPAFVIIILMSFTYNMGIGMTAGFLVYPVVKIFSGKYREIPLALWILSFLSLLFFIFYPY